MLLAAGSVRCSGNRAFPVKVASASEAQPVGKFEGTCAFVARPTCCPGGPGTD